MMIMNMRITIMIIMIMKMRIKIMIIMIMKMTIVNDNKNDHCIPEDSPGSVCNYLSIARSVYLDLI